MKVVSYTYLLEICLWFFSRSSCHQYSTFPQVPDHPYPQLVTVHIYRSFTCFTIFVQYTMKNKIGILLQACSIVDLFLYFKSPLCEDMIIWQTIFNDARMRKNTWYFFSYYSDRRYGIQIENLTDSTGVIWGEMVVWKSRTVQWDDEPSFFM